MAVDSAAFGTLLEHLRGGLIVSCQAREGNPMHGSRFMAAFAQSAELAGAVGIRANGAADVRAIARASSLPIIGINKQHTDKPVYITPTLAAARAVVRAGARIVALDATHRARQGDLSPEALIARIKRELGCLVMADIDTLEEGIQAEAAGADIIASTLSGYTDRTAQLRNAGPDLHLVQELARSLRVPVMCEGRITTPAHVVAAFNAGAFAVVVGTAITNPTQIAREFVAATPRAQI